MRRHEPEATVVASDLPVLLTRSAADNAVLASALRARGVRAVEWPAPRLEALPASSSTAAALGRAEIVVFTSRRGVEAASEAFAPLAQALAGRSVAAVGPSTAATLRKSGVTPRWTATGAGGVELANLLAREAPRGAHVLLLRNAAADRVLPDALAESGFEVEEVATHEAVPIESAAASCDPPTQAVAAVVSASPSAARRVLETRPDLVGTPFVAIGETTARALRALGAASVRVAREPSVEALVDSVLDALAMRSRPATTRTDGSQS